MWPTPQSAVFPSNFPFIALPKTSRKSGQTGLSRLVTPIQKLFHDTQSEVVRDSYTDIKAVSDTGLFREARNALTTGKPRFLETLTWN